MSQPATDTAIRKMLDENPAFAHRLYQFMTLYDASDVLEKLQPPTWELAVPWLQEIADHLMRDTGIGEDFLQAMIANRPQVTEPSQA